MKPKQKFAGLDFIAMISSLSKALEKRNLLKRLSSCRPFSIPSCRLFCKDSSIPSSFFLSTLFKTTGFKDRGRHKSLVVLGLVFIFFSFSLQAQDSCKALFTPEAVSKPTAPANKTQAEQPLTPETFAESMTKNLELNNNQEVLFDLYIANFFENTKTEVEHTFEDIMSTLEEYPELFKLSFREQMITFENRRYDSPESLNPFIKRFTSSYSRLKASLFNTSDLSFWKKTLGFKKSDQENFIKYLGEFLSQKDFDFLADPSTNYKQKAVFLYKALDKLREDQIKQGKKEEALKLSQNMLDLVHTIGLSDPYAFTLLKSENAKDRLQALHNILDARNAMAIELGFEGHFSELQKALAIASPSNFSKKDNIYEMLRRIEEDTLQSSSDLVDTQTFRLRALSLQESPFRSCVGGSDCSSNTYFFKALDPNFIYWTLTDTDHRSSGQITVVLGEAKDEKGDIVRVGFVDKIQNVPTDKIDPMLEGIRRSLKERGYTLGLPQDVGGGNGLSNYLITSKYIATQVNPKLEKKLSKFKPHKNSYDLNEEGSYVFENAYSRAYAEPALYEVQAGRLDLQVKIKSGSIHLPAKADKSLKKEDLFDHVLSLRNSKKEEDQILFIKQIGLLYNSEIVSFGELKRDLLDKMKDRDFSFKLRKLSFFSLIELYESLLLIESTRYVRDLSYDKILDLLEEFSKSEQKTLIGEMRNWAKGNNLKRRWFIENLIHPGLRSSQEIISILNSKIRSIIDINMTDMDSGRNPLMWAIKDAKIELVEILIEQGIDIHAVTEKSRHNALMMAIHYKQSEIAKLLIEKGIDIHAVNEDGENALMLAIIHKQPETAKLLIEKGIDIHAVNRSGENALMMAIHYKQSEIAKLLIEKGIDIHAVRTYSHLEDDPYDRTVYGNALMMAIYYKQSEIAKLLIEKGIDIHIEYGSALLWSIMYKQTEITKLLVEKGIRINPDYDERWYELKAEEFNKDTAKALTAKGIKVHQAPDNDKLYFIKEIWDDRNDPKTLKLLIKKGVNVYHDPKVWTGGVVL